jgi:tetratricopeptide (TPR) repeat protein
VSIVVAAGSGVTLKRVQELLGLSRTVVTGLVAAGFVSPERGARNEQRFTFQDLLLLRTAHALQRAEIPPRKILRALTRLSATLPAELPLTGLRITAVGAEVAVHDREGAWNPDTGQVLMDFDVAPAGAELAFLQRGPLPSTSPPADAESWFRRGEDLEATDLEAAERAYREAIALDARHAHAYLNLGALLCEAGRCAEASALYQQAIAAGAGSPLLHFNHAIALEDLGLFHQALASNLQAIELDAGLLDAHYNAGCLLEKMGDKQGALRHFSAASRLSKAET